MKIDSRGYANTYLGRVEFKLLFSSSFEADTAFKDTAPRVRAGAAGEPVLLSKPY